MKQENGKWEMESDPKKFTIRWVQERTLRRMAEKE